MDIQTLKRSLFRNILIKQGKNLWASIYQDREDQMILGHLWLAIANEARTTITSADKIIFIPEIIH
jgi:hypothetical protein